MQQLATKNADFAALPLNLDSRSNVEADFNGQGEEFASLLTNQQNADAAKSKSAGQQNEPRTAVDGEANHAEQSGESAQQTKKPTTDTEQQADSQSGKGSEQAHSDVKSDASNGSDDDKLPDYQAEAKVREENDLKAAADPVIHDTSDKAQDKTDYIALIDAIRAALNPAQDVDVDGALNQSDTDAVVASASGESNEELDPQVLLAQWLESGELSDKSKAPTDLEDKLAALRELGGIFREKITPVDPIVEAEVPAADSLQQLIAGLQQLLSELKAGRTDKVEGESVDSTEVLTVDSVAVDGASLVAMTEQLLMQIQQASAQSDSVEALPQATATIEALVASIQSQQNTESADDASSVELAAARLLALFAAQSQQDSQQVVSDSEAQALDNTALTAQLKSQVSAQSSSAEQASNADVAAQPITAANLLNDLAKLDDPVKEVAVNEVVAQVSRLLPQLSDAQQQQVKQDLVSAVNEFAKQKAAGHEPAINLNDLVAQAMRDAGVQMTQAEQTRIEQTLAQLQSASQLNHQLQFALNSQPQTTQYALAGVEAMGQDQAQLQAESSKTRQSVEAQDKPVAIHRQEGQQQMSEKIRWMVNSRNSLAEIRLDPPELGSMQVRVNVSGDTASVNFVVQSAQARDVVADAIPKLRDMLAQQGIQLGESYVSQQQQDGSEMGEQGSGGNGQFAGNAQDDSDESMHVVEQRVTRNELGGIDAYA